MSEMIATPSDGQQTAWGNAVGQAESRPPIPDPQVPMPPAAPPQGMSPVEMSFGIDLSARALDLSNRVLVYAEDLERLGSKNDAILERIKRLRQFSEFLVDRVVLPNVVEQR